MFNNSKKISELKESIQAMDNLYTHYYDKLKIKNMVIVHDETEYSITFNFSTGFTVYKYPFKGKGAVLFSSNYEYEHMTTHYHGDYIQFSPTKDTARIGYFNHDILGPDYEVDEALHFQLMTLYDNVPDMSVIETASSVFKTLSTIESNFISINICVKNLEENDIIGIKKLIQHTGKELDG